MPPTHCDLNSYCPNQRNGKDGRTSVGWSETHDDGQSRVKGGLHLRKITTTRFMNRPHSFEERLVIKVDRIMPAEMLEE